MMYRGIDVSSNNGTLDWDLIKPQIDYAIIRVGYGSDAANQDDREAIRNMQECERLGIPYGVYLYSYALSLTEVRSEAAHALRMVEGFNPILGVFFDMEDADYYKRNHGFNPSAYGDNLTDFCLEFMQIIKDAGYITGVYASYSYFVNILNDDRLTAFDGFNRWLAHWGINEPSMDCLLWQYSSDGFIDGVSQYYYDEEGNVAGFSPRFDMNYYYGDLEQGEDSPKKSNEEIAQEVLAGLWGNGQDRRDKLVANGYNYDAIQAIVNRIANDKRCEKNIDELAEEVLDGAWGNGSDRCAKLTAEGYDYDKVQARVNEILKVVQDVIDGKWGNGTQRRNAIEAEGLPYAFIQSLVNKRLK